VVDFIIARCVKKTRTALGQQHRAAVNEAAAERDSERIWALYQEAVRTEEALRAEEQYYTNLFLKYVQMLPKEADNTAVEQD
jgi:arginyl-tRNA--protein-N-Asp/Glu arginylyltransferase